MFRHQHELTKRTLIRLCGKRLRKERAYETYLLMHSCDIDRCSRCDSPIIKSHTRNIYELVRRLLQNQIDELRVEIEKEFQKLIAPNLDTYVEVCCGKVLIDHISFSKLMFELVYMRYKKMDGGLKTEDWSEFINEVIKYRDHQLFYSHPTLLQ